MTPETINKLLELAVPTITDMGEFKFTNRPLTLIEPPNPSCPVECSTLQGLVDLYTSELDELKTESEGVVFAHIVSPVEVVLMQCDADEFGRRRIYVKSKYPTGVKTFPYGSWLPPEEFIIAAQTCFQRVKIENDDGTMAQDLDYVLGIASDIKAENVMANKDDGIAQRVAVQAGVLLSETVLRPRVNLAPYRTFPEIDQVVSLFIFRARIDGNTVKLALFEADGGRWRLSVAAAIKDWLGEKLQNVAVIS